MLRTAAVIPLTGLALVAASTVGAGTPSPSQQRTSVEALRAGDDVTSTMLFTFKDDRITESSGLETSARFHRVLYTHNDSGDDARFFAVGRHGGTRAVLTLDGAGSWDWEDMAGGPNQTLWFGDIGANQLGREYISAYRVREPKKIGDRNLAWKRFDLVYDDGNSHNAEAMLVHPRTGRLYVVTKAESGAGVYRAPRKLSTSSRNVLQRIAGAPVKVTGGDFSPNGRRIVLRTYSSAYFYKKFGGHATEITLPSGGESIAFARKGAGVLVGKEGVHSPVWRVLRHPR